MKVLRYIFCSTTAALLDLIVYIAARQVHNHTRLRNNSRRSVIGSRALVEWKVIFGRSPKSGGLVGRKVCKAMKLAKCHPST